MPRNAQAAWAARPARAERLTQDGKRTGEYETTLTDAVYFRVNAMPPTGGWRPSPFGSRPDTALVIVASRHIDVLSDGLSVGDYVWVQPEAPDTTKRPLPQPAYVVTNVAMSPNGVSYALDSATGVI